MKLLSDYLIRIHQRYRQTDGQTDRRHSHSNTALCTYVLHAIKNLKTNDELSRCWCYLCKNSREDSRLQWNVRCCCNGHDQSTERHLV